MSLITILKDDKDTIADIDTQHTDQVKNLIPKSVNSMLEIVCVNCVYDNKSYSPGSVVKMADGSERTCRDDGTWF